ncbi:Uncharacterized protein DBV15_10244, partial [Temnothorax longispinosus]
RQVVEQEVERDGEVVAENRRDGGVKNLEKKGRAQKERTHVGKRGREGKSTTRETREMTREIIRECATCKLISCAETCQKRCSDKTRGKEDAVKRYTRK